jgi:hypothetical protein
MDLAARIKAEIDFEELLSAGWAEQLAKVRTTPHSGNTEARGGASGKAQVRLVRHGAQRGEGEDGHD